MISVRNEREIEAIVAGKPHALIVKGVDVSSNTVVAKSIAEKLASKLSNVSLFQTSEAKPSHGIELVRELTRTYKQKTASQTARVAIIDQAERMTLEAQNAMLKLLEEPPFGTHFVLTTSQIDRLLPTIRSRCQQLSLFSVSSKQMQQYVSSKAHIRNPGQLIVAADGGFGELTKLVEDEAYQQVRLEALGAAKVFLSLNDQYARLVSLVPFAKDKGRILQFLDDISLLNSLVLKGALKDKLQLAKTINNQQLTLGTITAIKKNASPQLQMDALIAHWQ